MTDPNTSILTALQHAVQHAANALLDNALPIVILWLVISGVFIGLHLASWYFREKAEIDYFREQLDNHHHVITKDNPNEQLKEWNRRK